MGKTKQKLRRGESVLGGWVMIGHPTSAETMAGEGFDFVGVDMEHTSIDIRAFHGIALAVKGTSAQTHMKPTAAWPERAWGIYPASLQAGLTK